MTEDECWEQFNPVIGALDKYERVNVGGYFNAHVGADGRGAEVVHGGVGVGTINNLGQKLLESVMSNNLAIANIYFFKSRPQNLITYDSIVGSSPIDYFLIKKEDLKEVKNKTSTAVVGIAMNTFFRNLLQSVA